ncbi:MAG: phosphate signaling complex protein PhoU [Anaerolineae bacterium]|nr:phosphate signaling complex protein PhoU [Anaerolineae bacterium]
MPRESLDKELQRLEDEILALGSMVENAITESVDALKKRDLEESRRLIAYDRRINEKRFEVEAEALAVIAMQQPVAIDLRVLAAVLDIADELERIGDYAKGIAKINLRIGEGPLLKPLVDIPAMAQKACSLLHRSLEAFIDRDVELARALPREDDDMDNLYNQVYRELMTYVIADPRKIEQANYLLWTAHNLERAADRVTNICERVIFTVTGELVEMDVENAGFEGVPG